MIKRYKIEDSRIILTDEPDSVVQLYISPTEEEKKILVDAYKLDEHTLISSLDPDELSRIEFEPDHAAIIMKRPLNYSGASQFLFTVSSFGIFVFRTRVIIVISEDVPLFEGKIFNKISSVGDVLLKLILRIIYHYIDHLKVINMISDSLENKINTSMKNIFLINLFTLEKSLVYYLNAINSNAFVIEKLKNNSARLGFTTENIEMIDDIIIENNQCYKQAEIYSNILAGLMDARVSIVSNNLNILMKTLNVITIGIMVPTFVVSAFSMNVKIPLSDHPLAFWIIIALALASVVSFMLFWRFKKW